MALNDRFGYGTSVDEIPSLPHVPRSARGRRSIRKKVEEYNMSAFDMLVAVAGKLLSKKEGPVDLHDGETRMDNIPLVPDASKEEQLSKYSSFRMETFDQHSTSIGKTPDRDVISEKEVSHDVKEQLFIITKTAKSGSDYDAMEPNKSHSSAIAKKSFSADNKCEAHVATEKWEAWNTSSRVQESQNSKGGWSLGHDSKPKMNSLDDPMDLDTKPSALLSSDSSEKVPLYMNNSQHTSCIPQYKDGMELVDKDEDERSSGCTHSSTLSYKDTKLQRIGDRRIRKIVASKHWKHTPKLLHNRDFSQHNIDMKPAIHGKKIGYTNQRSHRTSFKRRKLFVNPSLSTSRERAFNEALSDLHNKGSCVKVEGNNSHVCRANGASSATSGHKISYETPDCHVKLSIKSFKVPELFIEIPETATVASLKRTVMETVTAILGSGLHVGVLLEGKKVRDDNKTLRQAGIFHGDKLDNLGFTLEPNHPQASAPLMSSGNLSFLGIADVAEPEARTSPNENPSENQVAADSAQLALTSCPESDDSSHSPPETSVSDKTIANSRALVAFQPMHAEPLAVVPLRKPKRSEVVQRRIRRPFTVAEVEALVHAVEKLGTGRWRDVKQRAFDNAKHRTYVDLKDKWKTLVHTARISPQQRRGEPVPQDLLDRVLSAHAYWSQQLVKPSPQSDMPSIIL